MQQQQQAMQSLQAQLEAASAALADERGVNEALQVRAGGVFVFVFFFFFFVFFFFFSFLRPSSLVTLKLSAAAAALTLT